MRFFFVGWWRGPKDEPAIAGVSLKFYSLASELLLTIESSIIRTRDTLSSTLRNIQKV